MVKITKHFSMCLLGVIILIGAIHAQADAAKKQRLRPTPFIEDPRGEPELTICSQNLNNYGTYAQTRMRIDSHMTKEQFTEKGRGLAQRFLNGKCDVIAVQELLGTTDEEARMNLNRLGLMLRALSGRVFSAEIATTNDPLSRVGFLIAADRAEILAETSYTRVELPKILPKERPRFFLRGPFEIQLQVKSRDGSASRVVTIVNFHLKSQGGKGRDPAELGWETYRMQMAEAIRRIVETRHARSFSSSETILALVGDRNSNFDAASASILDGSLTLDDFKKDGKCRLSKRGVPYCKVDVHAAPKLTSVLTNDPQTKALPGTFMFKNEFSWLDEILLPSESLKYAWSSYQREGDYASFVISDPAGVSDHSLVGVTLNW